MATLEKAMPTLLKHEGGLVNHENDAGGTTKYGISFRFLHGTRDIDNDLFQDGDIDRDGDVDIDDIRNLSVEEATRLYTLYFWLPNKYFIITDQAIATKCFDLAVNMGGRCANRVTQRAIRSALGLRLIEDGIIGNKTLHAINMTNPDKLMIALQSEAAGVYRMMVSSQPLYSVFLRGWLNRAYSQVEV